MDYTSIKLAQTDGSFKVEKNIVTVQAIFAKQAGSLQTLEGTVRYYKGDALVTGIAEETWAVKRGHFTDSYNPIPPTKMGEDGTYTTHPIQAYALTITEDCQVTLYNGDKLTGKAGDYLLQYANGDYGILNDKIFKLLYKIIEQAAKQTNFDVFVSYSTKDKSFVDALVNKLENNKLRCWYAPRDIPAGMECPKATALAIRESKLIVLILSKYANLSPEITHELTLASNHKKPVIPVKIDDILPNENLEYHLTNRHWLDVYGLATEKAANQILENLEKFAKPYLTTNDITSQANANIESKLTIKPPIFTKTKKIFASIFTILLLITLGIGGWWYKQQVLDRQMASLHPAENLLVFTGSHSTIIKLLRINDPTNNTYLIQFNNPQQILDGHIFVTTRTIHMYTQQRFTITKNNEIYNLFIIINNDKALFYPPQSNKEFILRLDTELSKKANVKDFLQDYLQQQAKKTDTPTLQ